MELSRTFVLVAAVLLSFAVFAPGTWGQEGGPLILTQAYSGKEITVTEGAVFEVHLKQFGGTGYLWQIVDLDETRLKVLESTGIPLKEGRIVGGPSMKIWKIETLNKGRADLKIFLYRPWEGVEKPAERFVVTVRIR